MAFRFPDPKAPSERKTIVFDFTNELGTGVEITTATVTYTVASGAENPVTLANDSSVTAAVDSTKKKWLQPVKDGIDGVEYNCYCSATLNTGSTPSVLHGILGVRDPRNVWPTNYPSDSALTSVNALAAYLDPPSENGRADFLLRELIKRVSRVLVGQLNLDALYDSGASITEKRNGSGLAWLTPKVTPIISISSLKIGTTTIPASDGTSAGYLFDNDAIYLVGYEFTRGVQNITLVYRGGVVANSAIAQQMEQACIVTCALWWKRRAHIDHSSIAAPQGMGTISFIADDIPKEARMIINQYRRVAPVLP